ncbi:hypothetical protein SDC9_13521 [bioreactor metagenome]|uniref:Uncharacterized protein n=1 Tax=bioreactor metagenome TaxID=1076179 RepID=A0A644TLH9_9ZZZZ
MYPAFGGLDIAVLNPGQGVVQLLGDRAYLGLGMEHVKLAFVVDASDGRYDRRGSAGAGFDELVYLVYIAVPLLGLHAEVIARQVEQGVFGDGGEDGGGDGGYEATLPGDAEEVGRAHFLDFRVGGWVQIDAVGEARLGGDLVGQKASRVVAAHLGRTGAVGRGPVVLGDHEVDRGHAPLEIGAHGHAEHREYIFLGGTHADIVPHADDEGAQVQRGAVPVGRHVFPVGLYHLVAGVDEFFRGHLGHENPVAGGLHAGRVAVGPEKLDMPVLAGIGLQAFEALLAVVQGGGTLGNRQLVVGDQAAGIPGAVLPAGNIAVVGFHIGKRQFSPIQRRFGHTGPPSHMEIFVYLYNPPGQSSTRGPGRSHRFRPRGKTFLATESQYRMGQVPLMKPGRPDTRSFDYVHFEQASRHLPSPWRRPLARDGKRLRRRAGLPAP